MTKLRIATWNVDYPNVKNPSERSAPLMTLLEKYASDVGILVLTETDTHFCPKEYTKVAKSWFTKREGQSKDIQRWVMIWVKTQLLSGIPKRIVTFDEERTACVIAVVNGIELLIYGTVLPWTSDSWRGFQPKCAFGKALSVQASEWLQLKNNFALPMIVAGDFNQDLWAHRYYGSCENKELLKSSLTVCDLDWGKEGDPVAKATGAERRVSFREQKQHAAIDHICVSEHFKIVQKECWPRTDDSGKQLTDHFGSLVEVKLVAS